MAFKSTATFFALVVLSWATPFAYGQTQPTGIMHRRDVSLPSTPIPVGTTDQGNMVYHGGLVMHHVTVHTLFWAPTGFRFDGSPSPPVPGYEQLIKQFFSDRLPHIVSIAKERPKAPIIPKDR